MNLEIPVIYNTDVITSLDDCPFPLKTDSFEVLAFGRETNKDNGKFAIVEYRKNCGHLVQEKVRFEEGRQDFEHYETKFIGADYSIENWERRIELFRTIVDCDVCNMKKHALWIFAEGYSEPGNKTKKKAAANLIYLLDYNFENWREFVTVEEKEFVKNRE